MNARQLIESECDAIKELLIKKNKEYGNSAADPINVFSGMSAEEQLKVRIDDKLKRIQTIREIGVVQIPEDTEQDLIGYLVLLRVVRRLGQ